MNPSKTGRVHQAPQLALSVAVEDRPGILAALARVIFEHGANVTYVGIDEREGTRARVFFELESVSDEQALVVALTELEDVTAVAHEPTFHKVFGRRIIVIGAGAQVGSVVMGAVSEADRHNIRGERISVDTIPLVGEAEIAEAVRACIRLPRVEALVLAGSLMGGEITKAVLEVREKGIVVVSLNMAGSVPGAADLVVSDPQQAGVMAVMLVASTAKLDIQRIRGRRF
ncbi:MAG: energy-converting hydrogenase subunit [Chloroflexota bacterium]|nr:energy-converting hydrogenase subunit [Chloroflexota bacterium]